MVRREKSNYTIQSVSHALDVMEQFNGSVDEIGVTELSKRLKLHKNNVFRLLATLEARGYIEQNKVTENYRLGFKVLATRADFHPSNGVVAPSSLNTGGFGQSNQGKRVRCDTERAPQLFLWSLSNLRVPCVLFRFWGRHCRLIVRLPVKCIWSSSPKEG